MNLDSLPKSERVVEVPFAVQHCWGKVLDVGQDKVGYTRLLRDSGCEVKSCDIAGSPDYLCRFEDMQNYETFDTILLLSSLEHFKPTERNLKSPFHDAYCINKCRELLSKSGRIVITLPYGREYIPGDFIQWSYDRVRQVQEMVGVNVVNEEVEMWDGAAWSKLPVIDLDVEYHHFGAEGAGAVYLGVWTF